MNAELDEIRAEHVASISSQLKSFRIDLKNIVGAAQHTIVSDTRRFQTETASMFETRLRSIRLWLTISPWLIAWMVLTGNIFQDDLLLPVQAIETARLLAELAQFNLACLEAAVRKHTDQNFRVGGQDNLWDLMRYDTKTSELIDDADYHRVGYFVRKYRYPSELITLGTHGLLEDFFGAWVDERGHPDCYNPDGDWNLLLDFG